MKVYRKRTTTILCYWLIAVLLLNGLSVPVSAQENSRKEKAVLWLQTACNENQEWEDEGLPNRTCDAMALLRTEGVTVQSTYLSNWVAERSSLNVDELCHLIWADGDTEQLSLLWSYQNEDGGFGLTGDYESDVYDTLLVLQAELAVRNVEKIEEDTGGTDTEKENKLAKAIQYLMSQQREDGGFGYTKYSDTDPELTADIGTTLLALGVEAESFFEGVDAYCQKMFQMDFAEESFIEQAKLAGYLYDREQIENPADVESALYAIQEEQGSVYNSARDTIRYILLLNQIETYYQLKLTVDSVITDADTFVLEAGKEQVVTLTTNVQYEINQALQGTLRYSVMEDDTVIQTKEETCSLTPDQKEAQIGTTITITATEGSAYKVFVELVSTDEAGIETIWGAEEIDFSVHKTEEKEFLLEAESVTGETNGVALSWTDLSDGDNRYGYRVFRKQDEGEWETRSTWDGEEQVKVLNVFPCYAAENYLIEWMETTIGETEEPAGKGLFEIDKVYIGDYNKTPDAYLLDEEGNYKYDVLVFGTYDSNDNKDLSDISYEATQRFVDAGRGVLFGHDTVLYRHTNFAKFADQLGAVLKSDYYLRGIQKVNVVNEGFLTSYPWKLSGTLTVPTTHTQGQYTGKGLPATVWMELQGENDTDEENGWIANAYLFSRNQLAMIQTGHSRGAATDDERKIIANTMFYLKQLTHDTNTIDQSACDVVAPEVTDVPEEITENQVLIQARDRGTKYQYYVEAVSEKEGEESRESNIVEIEACSGVKGYVIGVSDSETPMEDLLTYDEEGNLINELMTATEGSIVYTLDDMEIGEGRYLHIYVVDHAGNVSEEIIHKVEKVEPQPEEPEEPEVPEEPSEKEYFNSPYALFATDSSVELYCNQANIKGDVYGNSMLKYQGTTLQLQGKGSTSGTLSLAGGKMVLAEQEEGIEPLTLPDYMDAIRKDVEESEPLEELNAYNSTEITIPTMCNSTTGAWCNDVKIGATLLSKGTIRLNANTISCGAKEKVVLCSEEGDIQIQATKFGGSGFIYAPNGTVTINVSEFNFQGTIIAKKIWFQATTINMNQE